MNPHAVAITGLGANTCRGRGVAELWRSLSCGTLSSSTQEKPGDPRRKVLELAEAAVREAMAMAEGSAALSWNCPLILGTNVGRVGLLANSSLSQGKSAREMLAPGFCETWADHHDLAEELRRRLALSGESVALTGACASGALALGYGFDLVTSGACERVIAGGADELTDFKLVGHQMLGSASRQGVSRPFDVRRDGTSFCEGAGFVILESLERCQARGGRPLSLLAGYGVGTDTGSLTAPDPSGAGARIAMRAALVDAGLGPEAVDHIQAHGTGTRLNDATEAQAIREVIGPHLDRMTVSADKGAIGHTFGASGVLSLILTVMMMGEGCILPTYGCEQTDPECELPLVCGQSIARRTQVALCNNFGFGGTNVSLVIKCLEASA